MGAVWLWKSIHFLISPVHWNAGCQMKKGFILFCYLQVQKPLLLPKFILLFNSVLWLCFLPLPLHSDLQHLLLYFIHYITFSVAAAFIINITTIKLSAAAPAHKASIPNNNSEDYRFLHSFPHAFSQEEKCIDLCKPEHLQCLNISIYTWLVPDF